MSTSKCADRSAACTDAPSGAHAVLTIDLPLPPKACHQNRSGRRGGLHDEIVAKMEARTYATYAAKAAITQAFGADITVPYGDIAPAVTTRTYWGDPPRWRRVTVDVLFRFPDRRRRDLANYLGACKAYFDGIGLAGVWVDDSGIVDLRARATVDRANPGVEITIREGAD